MGTAIPFGFTVPLEPGFYAELDGSRSGVSGRQLSKVMVLGHRASAGTVAKDLLTFVPSIAAGKTYFGRGSFLAREIEILKLAYPGAEVWAIAQDEDAAGAAAAWTLTVTGPATASGTLFIYIAGQLVTVAVTVGDAANTIANAINAAIGLALDLPVTATVLDAVVTATCRHKSIRGNDINIQMNYKGARDGEVLPAGVTVTIVQTVQGTTEPILTNSIAAMVDNQYDTIINPYSSSTSLEALETEMASRWSATRMVHGHVVGAKVATYADLITFGTSTAQNDPHVTILGYYASPTPTWEVAAALGALTAEKQMDATDATLAQGFTGHKLYGMKAPTAGAEFTIAERNVLLGYGIATYTVTGSDCYLSMPHTTYRTDSSGTPDAAYADQRTLAILQRIIRSDKAAWQAFFQGAVLVEDATKVNAGQKVCSPAIGKGWFSQRYSAYVRSGLVTDLDRFLDDLVIQLSETVPNQMEILYPPQISRWLAVTAMQCQFRLV